MRHVKREIRRIGLYQIEYQYGSVAQYLMTVWGFGPRRAERLEESLYL